jgi:importin subunit beta-1
VQRENVNLRIATLQAIGYICEVVRPEVLATRSNEILTAVVQGARKEETSPEVQAAAIQALYNSLEFIRDNFDREGERNYIMQVVCEATQSANVVVQIGAFECLVRIMQLYYDKMALYMERALFGLTVLGMQNQEEKVALQAVEFWSTVCEEEAELALEAAEAAEYQETPTVESRHFAKVALPEILPVILSLLTKQDEDAEDDEWNVSMSAGTCVGLLASVVGDAIVPLVIPFIEANIQDGDWRKRDAAVMVFGSILDGPDDETLTPLVLQAMPTLINMMQDPHHAVKDTVAWTLGRITDLMFRTIDPAVHLQPLIQAVGTGLQDSGRIAANCCWAIKNLAIGYGPDYSEDGLPQATNALSPYYQALLETLMRTSESRWVPLSKHLE